MKKSINYPFLVSVLIIIGVGFAFSMNGPSVVDPESYQPAIYSTPGSLLPPILAIALALITREVYSSLFVGILVGAALYSNGNMLLMLNTMLYAEESGMISKLSDSWNVGILVFLVILGIMVALMNKIGASKAFGRWASKNITSRVGAQIATVVLGMLIFIDDYFNCLTVGSVMRPVTDRHNVSRAKLAYLIDSTAAPICIIAPVSSWAAAVTSSIPKDVSINGFSMFIHAIPYNFYAISTILMMFILAAWKFDFGPMRRHEQNALCGDLFTTDARPYGETPDDEGGGEGHVIDLIFPIAALISCCVIGMIYTGGYFDGASFVDAFADADASKGLVLGSMVTLMIIFIFYMGRGIVSFHEFASCIPEGFKAMVAPIMILTLAWTLSGMTGLLGAKFYVRGIVENSAGALEIFLPAILFVIAAFLAFSTGTSWGTFGILIPIVCSVFSPDQDYQLLVISISATLSGSVCGDHCSPISDTTIMASAGSQSDHINHVATQLPYAITAACVSAVGYLIAGFLAYKFSSLTLIALPIVAVLLFLVLTVIKKQTESRERAVE